MNNKLSPSNHPYEVYKDFPEKKLTEEIIGAAIEVHKFLGPGLLETAYQACMERELDLRKIQFEKQKSLPIEYKGVKLDCDFRLDLLVENKVIVELKTVETLASVHEAQLLTYMKLTGCKIGLLINFNVPVLKTGIKRLIL
jgi:GxxExxY protein